MPRAFFSSQVNPVVSLALVTDPHADDWVHANLPRRMAYFHTFFTQCSFAFLSFLFVTFFVLVYLPPFTLAYPYRAFCEPVLIHLSTGLHHVHSCEFLYRCSKRYSCAISFRVNDGRSVQQATEKQGNVIWRHFDSCNETCVKIILKSNSLERKPRICVFSALESFRNKYYWVFQLFSKKLLCGVSPACSSTAFQYLVI